MVKIIEQTKAGRVLASRFVRLCVGIIVLLGLGGNAYAQVVVKGKVIGADNEPLIGAMVFIEGTRHGCTTDADGNFEFTTKTKGCPCTLRVKHIGYKTIAVVIKNKDEARNKQITLEEDNVLLDDVIVVGYGKSSRKKLTGAVGQVKSSVITQATQEAPIMALQGNMSGVYVTQGSGVPGAGSSDIVIRGKSTLSSQSQPLYIIDGVPFNASSENQIAYTSTGVFGLPDALNLINPSDIESIEVLKDADATAIYGTRGANGVILVTTKKGSAGRVKVSASFSTTVSQVAKRLDFLGTEDYLALRRKAFDTDLANGYVTEEDYIASKYPDLLLWDQHADYNWQDELIGKTSVGYDAQVNVSGGNQNTSFFVSGAYYSSNTVLISDDQYDRWTARANINHQTSDHRFHLEAGVTLSGINMNSHGAGSPYTYLNTAPNTPLFDELGRPYYIPDDPDYASSTDFLAYEGKNASRNVLGNLTLSYKIWRELTAKVSVGYNYSSSDQSNYYQRYWYNPYDPYYYNFARYYSMNTSTTLVEPQLTYRTGLAGGELSLLVGGTYQAATSKTLWFTGKEYPNDAFMTNASSAASFLNHSNPSTQTKTASFFTRVSYDYKDRYLLNAVYRRDGSSRFGPDHRFGNFYSVGTGWLFSNEAFVKERIGDVLSFGKLRFSYGRTGNDGVGDYAYMTKYSTSSYPYEGQVGLAPTGLANDDLHWETTNKLDVGLELGFLKDRLQVNASWFRNRSFDLLTREYLPAQVGFSYISSNLDAVIDNRGWEVEINSQNIKTHDFAWNTSFNITIPKNELVEYEGLASSAYYNTYSIGQSVNVVRGYKYLGVNKETGLAEVEDLNRDGRIANADDYQNLGTRDPQFYGGLTNTFKYKNFTLDFSFYFRKKTMEYGYFWLYMYPIGVRKNVTKEMAANYWTTPGQEAKYPGLTTTSSSPQYNAFQRYFSYSDGAYSNGSYLRLQNVMLSYDFPRPWLSSLGISALRLYAQGKNLFTITDYDSYDPETSTAAVPSLRSFIFGLNVTF